MINVALIDKNPVMLLGLSQFIGKNFGETNFSKSKDVADLKVSNNFSQFDIIIIGFNDYSHKYILDAISKLSKWYPGAGIILYDEEPDSAMAHHYLKAGARGYLSKQDDVGDLITCINRVLTMKLYLNESLMMQVIEGLTYTSKIPNKYNPLSAREFLIASYLSKGIELSWIAGEIGKNPSTIRTIKRNILNKLGVDNVVRLRDVIQQIVVTDPSSVFNRFSSLEDAR